MYIGNCFFFSLISYPQLPLGMAGLYCNAISTMFCHCKGILHPASPLSKPLSTLCIQLFPWYQGLYSQFPPWRTPKCTTSDVSPPSLPTECTTSGSIPLLNVSLPHSQLQMYHSQAYYSRAYHSHISLSLLNSHKIIHTTWSFGHEPDMSSLYM